MPRKRRFYPHLEMCLCNRCASNFYASPYRFIRPLDPLLPTLDICDLCRARMGKGYRISLPS